MKIPVVLGSLNLISKNIYDKRKELFTIVFKPTKINLVLWSFNLST